MDPHINPASGVWDDNYFANKNKGGGGGAPAPSFNPEAYDNLLKNTPKAGDMVQGINANENNAFSDYLDYIKGQASPIDFYNKISEAQGIPGLRKTQSTLQGQIYDLEDTLRRVEPDVTANTSQSLVTESQRRGMVTEKQRPLVENLGWLGQSLGRVSSAVSEADQRALNLTQLNEQGQQKFIDAFKTKLQLATSQGDRALQAFIKDTDTVLDVTLAKIHRGEQVSDIEAANAFEIFKMNKQAELNLKELEFKASQPKDLMSLSEGTTVYDPNTGQVKYTVPKTYKSEGGGGGSGAEQYYPDFYDNDNDDSEWEVLPQFRDIRDYNNWLSK